MGLIGGIIGGVTSAAAGIASGIAGRRAARRNERILNQAQDRAQDWYDKEYYSDFTQRSDAQAALNSARQILISELVLSKSQSYESAEAELDTALA